MFLHLSNRINPSPRLLQTLHLAICSLTLLAFAPAASAQEEENRWEMLGGRGFNAEFVRVTDDGVVLRSVDSGAEKEFKFSQLSIASHFKAKKLANPKAYNKPVPKAPVKEIVEPAAPEFTVDSSELMEYPFPDDPTIEQWCEVLESGFADKNAMVAWHALPERMQEDLEDIGVEAVGMLSSGQFKQIARLMSHLRTVVTEQKDFVFGNKYFQQIPVEKGKLEEVWPKVAGLVAAFTDSRHWQQENFAKGKIVESIAVLIADVTPHSVAAGEAIVPLLPMPPGISAADQDVQFKVIKSGKSRATVAITTNGATNEVQFQKVGKKWVVPSFMNDMRKGVDEAKKGLAGFDKSQLGGLSIVLGAFMLPAEGIATAESQEEFDGFVDSIIESVNQMAPGGPPGGGRPGF